MISPFSATILLVLLILTGKRIKKCAKMVSRLKDLYRHFYKHFKLSNARKPLTISLKKQNSEDFTNIISNKQIAKKTWTRNRNFEEKQREKKETLQGFKTLALLRAEPTKKLCVTTKKNCKQYETSLVLFLIQFSHPLYSVYKTSILHSPYITRSL